MNQWSKDTGTAALLAVVWVAAVGVAIAVVIAVLNIVIAEQRASAAADAAALAVLTGSPLAGGGGDPSVAAAAGVAAANGAEIVSIDSSQWPLSVVVETQVRVDLYWEVTMTIKTRSCAVLRNFHGN